MFNFLTDNIGFILFFIINPLIFLASIISGVIMLIKYSKTKKRKFLWVGLLLLVLVPLIVIGFALFQFASGGASH